ncbi:MAG TPA: hypothetical protein VK741_01295, partial [Acetobacteraceae bacterium]|nr:hypothetical protein [Acetobacteraceae bacterium]
MKSHRDASVRKQIHHKGTKARSSLNLWAFVPTAPFSGRHMTFCQGPDSLVSEHGICAWKRRSMDLLQALRSFIRVTETGSFSAVARET